MAPNLSGHCVYVSCIDLVLNFVETWGDKHYIGLTGVELLGKDGQVIHVDVSMIDAEPQDLHQLPGHEDDQRTIDKSAMLCYFIALWTFIDLKCYRRILKIMWRQKVKYH